jgi:hypothetical protein
MLKSSSLMFKRSVKTVLALCGLVTLQAACAPDATPSEDESGSSSGQGAGGAPSGAAGSNPTGSGTAGNGSSTGGSNAGLAGGASNNGGANNNNGGANNNNNGGANNNNNGGANNNNSGGANNNSGTSGATTSSAGAAATTPFGQVSALLDKRCAGMKCHGTGSMQLPFAAATGTALHTLLTTPIPAATPHCVGVTLATANDTTSPLLQIVASGGKIACTKPKAESVGPMPDKCTTTLMTATGECLTAAEIKILSDWISAGAPD